MCSDTVCAGCSQTACDKRTPDNRRQPPRRQPQQCLGRNPAAPRGDNPFRCCLWSIHASVRTGEHVKGVKIVRVAHGGVSGQNQCLIPVRAQNFPTYVSISPPFFRQLFPGRIRTVSRRFAAIPCVLLLGSAAAAPQWRRRPRACGRSRHPLPRGCCCARWRLVAALPPPTHCRVSVSLSVYLQTCVSAV